LEKICAKIRQILHVDRRAGGLEKVHILKRILLGVDCHFK